MKNLSSLDRPALFTAVFLISLYILSALSFAATFNPTTIQELIDDINTANSNGEADDINLVPGMVYIITDTTPGVPFSDGFNGDNGLPIILADSGNSLTINGNGATIERDPSLFTDPDDPCSGAGLQFRILQITENTNPNDDVNLTINDLKIQNGCGFPGGGGIFKLRGNLHLNKGNLFNNKSLGFGFGGGGIAVGFSGITEIVDSIITKNKSENAGGGISSIAGGTFSIKNSIISENTSDLNAGGITMCAGCTIEGSTISHNIAPSGGGIWSVGQMPVPYINTSTITGNEADEGGGILNADFSSLVITNSTISDNEASVTAGGISTGISSTLTVINNTISENSSFFIGGLLARTNSTVKITNCTIFDNTAVQFGGGIENRGTLDLKNSIIAGNIAGTTDPNCINGGTLNDIGGNISDDNTDACMFAFNMDWDSATMLGPLQDNGGGTFTYSLIETMMPSNPAIDAIAPANCTDQQMVPVAITDDQRFFPRPSGTNCDVGAFELQQTGMVTVEKITVPAGGTGFDFQCGVADFFTLDDTETNICILPVGMSTIDEVVPPGFVLDVICDETPISTSSTGVTLDISGGDDISCTFTNTNEFTLDLTIAGNGTGTVDITPPGETCEPDCSHTYVSGTDITLAPNVGAFSTFNGFSGDTGCGADITITENIDCTATFTLMQFLLSVTTSGTGDGSVTAPAGAGDGINCGEGNTNCDELYDAMTMVTLMATPDADSLFTGWTGACAAAGTNPMATVDMTSAMSCDAEFTLQQFDVTVNIIGPGSGTVTSAPPGINCPGDCTETYDIHTAITLTPTPDAVSAFTGWSPNCAGGVIADLTADTVCTATFDLLPLILNPINPGVASNPNIITVEQATPNGSVAYLWSFQTGSTIVGGPTCNGIELGLKNPQVLGIRQAGANQIANLVVYIPLNPAFENPVFMQAADIPTCRTSEVVTNIILNE